MSKTALLFVGKGPAKTVEIGGSPVKQLRSNRQVTHLANTLYNGSGVIGAGARAFKVDPEVLREKLSTASARKLLFHDLINYTSGYGLEEEFLPEDETVNVRTLQRKKAFGPMYSVVVGDHVQEDDPADKQRADKLQFGATYRSIYQSLVTGFSGQLYHAKWTNHDDSSVKGLVGIDRKTGEVRVFAEGDWG